MQVSPHERVDRGGCPFLRSLGMYADMISPHEVMGRVHPSKIAYAFPFSTHCTFYGFHKAMRVFTSENSEYIFVLGNFGKRSLNVYRAMKVLSEMTELTSLGVSDIVGRDTNVCCGLPASLPPNRQSSRNAWTELASFQTRRQSQPMHVCAD